MADYSRVLCLFCKVGKEKRVVERLHEMECGRAIFPNKVQKMLDKSTRKWEEVPIPLLPGYVFLYETDRAIQRGELASVQNVIRILNYKEDDSDSLRGQDLEFAAWLWQTDGHIQKVKAMEIGDRIEIVDSAFQSLQGTIRRVDRRRQTCQIELDAKGLINQIWIPYELVRSLERT